MGDRRSEGNALGSLGPAYADLGEPRRAIELFEQRLAIAREIGDRDGEGAAFGNMGLTYANLGESRRAIELFEQHLAIAREIGDRDGEAKANWNLGVIYVAEGDLRRAVSLMGLFVAYEREIGHPAAEKHAALVHAICARLSEPPTRVHARAAGPARAAPAAKALASQTTVLDFFVSYNRQDRIWAEWIAWTLEERGHTTVLQAWDFRPGSNFVLEMQKAASGARQTIMVLSPAYLAAEYTQAEWAAAFSADPRGAARKLIPVRVTPCEPTGLLGPVIYIDLVGLSAEEAAAALLGGLAERAKPETKPAFPGSSMAAGAAGHAPRMAPQEIPFPGSGALLPRQLPSPPADFVGREAELAALRAAAGDGGPIAVFGLRGLGGVGKTALALKLAGELAPRYPDGQIFLDLQGVSTGVTAAAPLSPAQAMAHVIRSFLPEARLPEGAAELAGLYRTVLHGRRVLLLMDNAARNEQVEPLIPPEGSALLVTSRSHFHLPGAATRDLGELPEADARALLLGIAPTIGEDAGEIAGLCGRLPFALRLAGSALADRPDLAPADYARSLARAEHRFGPVDASLEVSLTLLGEEPRRLWCRLAVFPATFDREAAAAVWELEPDAANAAMGELLTASLVEWEAGRYRLHDLARLFARGRLGGEEAAIAELRHAAHYLEVLWRTDRLYKEGGGALLRGLRLFDTEWPNSQIPPAKPEA